MGKNKLMTGMVVGALIGGLMTLTDRSTRTYTKRKIQDVTDKTKDVIQNPSDVIESAKIKFNQYNDAVQNGADNAINALEQVESTLDRLSNKSKK